MGAFIIGYCDDGGADPFLTRKKMYINLSLNRTHLRIRIVVFDPSAICQQRKKLENTKLN